MKYLITNWISTSQWVKTTTVSWVATASATGFHLAPAKEEIQAWALLVGGILIPLASFALHIYKTFKKK